MMFNPPDPLNEWQSSPLEPAIRGKELFGRGASDDKGQMFTYVKAVESYLQSSGKLPVNIKCIFEGEEEISSPNLPAFLHRYRNLSTVDVAVLSDMPMLEPNRPTISESIRGMRSLEMEIRGAERDPHAGLYGGAIHNPLESLCEIIASFHDSQGRVTIPGFYSQVRDLNPHERAYMRSYGPGDTEILHCAGGRHGYGEPGYTLYERSTIRPSLTVTGIGGGYQGAGPKAVIPNRAMAKLDFRLVPDQQPEDQFTPPTIQPFVRKQSSAKPAVIPPRHPALCAAFAASRAGFGATPVFSRLGGTIPVIALLQDILGIQTVPMGFALPTDRIHAPNEKFHLANFFNGISTCIHFLSEMADQSSSLPRTAHRFSGQSYKNSVGIL